MYKPLADSTLMGMTKKEIIEQLRIAEHNYQAVKETVNQQAENFIKIRQGYSRLFRRERNCRSSFLTCNFNEYMV